MSAQETKSTRREYPFRGMAEDYLSSPIAAFTTLYDWRALTGQARKNEHETTKHLHPKNHLLPRETRPTIAHNILQLLQIMNIWGKIIFLFFIIPLKIKNPDYVYCGIS